MTSERDCSCPHESDCSWLRPGWLELVANISMSSVLLNGNA